MQIDPELLRARLDSLERAKEERRLNVAGASALAEAAFRLALLPSTEALEAVRLLCTCVRLDGANPLYAYHLARVYHAHGELDQARLWMGHVARLCPTSHRLWAHASQLQWELNFQYEGNERYEPNVLRGRSESLSEAIRTGRRRVDKDWVDFVPPKARAAIEQEARAAMRGSSPGQTLAVASAEDVPQAPEVTEPLPPEELEGGGECRWSGIHDLFVQRLLEAEPSRRTLQVMLPRLEEVARLASQRTGGEAAFCILGIQWLCAGYPVETVLRLMEPLSGSLTSVRLLASVCEVYGAPREEAPRLLAAAIEQADWPEELAAVVQSHRVLWQPLEYTASRSYRSARRLLAELDRTQPDGRQREQLKRQANELLRKLRKGLAQLDREPPSPLEDVRSDGERADRLTSESAAEVFSDLENRVVSLEHSREEAQRFLKNSLEPSAKNIRDAAGMAKVAGDRIAFRELMAALEKVGGVCRSKLAEVVEVVGGLDAGSSPECFAQRREACDKRLTRVVTIGALKRILARVEQALDKAAAEHAVDPSPPTKELAELLAAVRDAAPDHASMEASTPMKDTVEKPSSHPPARRTGGAGLGDVIRETDRRLEELFESAFGSFAQYPSMSLRAGGPLWLVRRSVQARQAETYHRLGHRRRARQIWSEMLREDPLDLAVLKNVAVSDTGAREIAREQASWRHYLDALYARDILSGSLLERAEPRGDLHREFGNSYAFAQLTQDLKGDWTANLSERGVVHFLSQTGRVRNFVDNKLLEFLNRHLGYSSPLLTLGVSRSDSPDRRAGAAQRLTEYAEESLGSLSERVRERVRLLFRRRMDEALETCKDHRRLLATSDVSYRAERERHIALLVEFAQLKYKLLAAVRACELLSAHASSVEFLAELRRLDRIPLDLSAEFTTVAAGSIQHSPEDMMQMMRAVEQTFVRNLLAFIFTGPENEEETRHERYRTLVEHWARTTALRDSLDLIDNPQPWFPPNLMECLRTGVFPKGLVPLWRTWHERYPEITGLARGYARALKEADEVDTAIAVLERAAERGLRVDAREDCRQLATYFRFQQECDQQHFAKAAKTGLELLRNDDHQAALVQNVMVVHVNAAKETLADPGRAQLEREVSAWVERARRRIRDCSETEEEPRSPIQEQEVEEVRQAWYRSVVQLVLAYSGGKSGNDWATIASELECLEQTHSNLADACFYRMYAHFNLAASLSHSDPALMKVELAQAKTQANRVLAIDPDEDHHEKARSVLVEIARRS